MNYKVHDSKRGKIFATMAEASAYADLVARETRVILLITETRAKVTHIYDFNA